MSELMIDRRSEWTSSQNQDTKQTQKPGIRRNDHIRQHREPQSESEEEEEEEEDSCDLLHNEIRVKGKKGSFN